MRAKPELLCPAGDMEKLNMAVLYGADAVYLAGTSFGMRSFAGNFDDEALPKAVRFAHDHGVKVHATVNTMPRWNEAEALPAHLEKLDAAGVDALILAAGALVALRGGTGEQIGHAVAMALKNLMGLICDPVAGLVEVPCVKRNVIGAVNAVSVADMAMAGITSRIPVDEVIDAMGEVGRRMPVEFRETALGGLAVTPTGTAIQEHMRKSPEVAYDS